MKLYIVALGALGMFAVGCGVRPSTVPVSTTHTSSAVEARPLPLDWIDPWDGTRIERGGEPLDQGDPWTAPAEAPTQVAEPTTPVAEPTTP